MVIVAAAAVQIAALATHVAVVFAEDEDYEVVVALGAVLAAVVPHVNLVRTCADTAVAEGVKE